MKMMVTKDNIADIYHQLSEKAPYEQYVKTKKKLKELDRATGNSMARFEDLRAANSLKMDKFVEDLTKGMKQLNTEMREFKFEQNDRVNDVRHRIVESFHASQKVGSDLQGYIAKMDERLLNYASIQDFHKIDERLTKDYTTRQRHDDLEFRVCPLIANCERTLQSYRQDNEDVKEAIISFDKVLSTKANQWNIVETRSWCEQEFISVKATESNNKTIQRI